MAFCFGGRCCGVYRLCNDVCGVYFPFWAPQQRLWSFQAPQSVDVLTNIVYFSVSANNSVKHRTAERRPAAGCNSCNTFAFLSCRSSPRVVLA
jgi:hypothetical protein